MLGKGSAEPTRRQIFTVATGVHQHIGLERGVKLVVSAVEKQRSLVLGSVAAGSAVRVHLFRTCCRAECQASTPGRGRNAGS